MLRVSDRYEEELSRQFLYLLFMNSFYPDPALYNSGSTTGTPTGSGGSPVSTNLD